MPPFSGREIRLSATAEEDLRRIADYTRRHWGDRQRTVYLGRIRTLLADLRDRPGIGAARPEIAPGLRAHPVGRHVVFYRDTEAALVVVRILHRSMDPRRHVDPDPDDG